MNVDSLVAVILPPRLRTLGCCRYPLHLLPPLPQWLQRLQRLQRRPEWARPLARPSETRARATPAKRSPLSTSGYPLSSSHFYPSFPVQKERKIILKHTVKPGLYESDLYEILDNTNVLPGPGEIPSYTLKV